MTTTTATPTWLTRLDGTDRVGWESLSGKVRTDERDAFRTLCADHGDTVSERIRRLVLLDLEANAIPYPGPATTTRPAEDSR